MEKNEAILKILYLLSSTDGEVSGKEMNIILDYIKEKENDPDFDSRKTIRPLLFMGREDSKKELEKSAEYLKTNSTESERLEIMKFAAELLAADGRFDIEEVRLINIIAKNWGIDIDKFMNEIFGT